VDKQVLKRMRQFLRNAPVDDDERRKLTAYFECPWLLHAMVARVSVRWQGRLLCEGTSGMGGRVLRFLESEKFFCQSAPQHIKPVFVSMILEGVAVHQQLAREVSRN
jgi:hypothetical protein